MKSRKAEFKRKKSIAWKVVPCALSSPRTNRIPTIRPLNLLRQVSLDTLWFCSEDRLEIGMYYTPKEVNFIVVTLYPMLKNMWYENFKATGPGNSILDPLTPPPSTSSRARRFSPHAPLFSADQLKNQIGRKGRLYIRPCSSINTALLSVMPEHEVSILFNCLLLSIVYQ